MRFTHAREEWLGGLPFTGPSFEWSDVDLFVIHFPGGDELPTGDPGETLAQFARHLQASHRYYLNDASRGYSYGYNAVVDWTGGSWEVRGEEFENAANKYANGRSFSVQIVVDRQDPATDAQVAEVNRLYVEACAAAGRTLKILGHKQTTVAPYGPLSSYGTSCPGAGIFAQIQAGRFGFPAAPPPTSEEDEVTEADRLLIIAGVTEAIRGLNIPAATVNFPLPVDAGTADAWTVDVDARARIMSLQGEVTALREDVARLVAELDGPSA